MKILPRDFYLQPTLKVARGLLGKILWYKRDGKVRSGKIVETEGYLRNDPACHALHGMTESNKVMFGPAGHAYVYFIYGMYNCLNAVTQKEGIAEAVLIRAVEPIKGIKGKTNGPGKVCREFRIDKNLNGTDLTRGNFVILENSEDIGKIYRAPRIGISEATDKLWRFYIDSEFVSKK